MKAKEKLPVIGRAIGDLAGMGPEPMVKDLSKPEFHRLCGPVLREDSAVLEKTNEELKMKAGLSLYPDQGTITAKSC
jgi:4-hydroxy-L-threonine phosphate dehydrogenase PdxA